MPLIFFYASSFLIVIIKRYHVASHCGLNFQVQQRPGGYSPQNIGPGPNMIPRGPQPSYKRSNVDNRGPPTVPSNKRFDYYETCSSYAD